MTELKMNFEKMVEGFIKTAKEKGLFVGWWIPVSERLPEENGNYLVTVVSADETADITYISVDHYGPNWLHEDKHHTVTAWMPLPDPYKAESEE